MTYEQPPVPHGLARLWILPSGYRRFYWHDHVLSAHLPRVWRWASTVFVRFGIQFLLGILIYRDEDGDLFISVGAGPVEVTIEPIRMLTRREVRKRNKVMQDELGAEIEDYLRREAAP